MNHTEANRRMDAAIQVLLTEGGWTMRQVERAFNGMMQADAVESAERYAEAALGLDGDAA